MNKSAMTFAMTIALAAVFALAAPADVAIAQTSDALPDGEGEGEYKDGEHKEGKVCPVTGKTLQFQGQFS